MKCPRCGAEAQYVKEYKRYYCKNCKKYLPQEKKQGIITQIKKSALLARQRPIIFLPALIPTIIYIIAYVQGSMPISYYDLAKGLEQTRNLPQIYRLILSPAALLSTCMQLYFLKSIEQKSNEPLKEKLKNSLIIFPEFLAGTIIAQTIQLIGLAFLIIPGAIATLFLFYNQMTLIKEELSYKDTIIYSALIGKSNWKKTLTLLTIFLPMMFITIMLLPAGHAINALLTSTLFNITLFLTYTNTLKKPEKPERKNKNQLITIITIMGYGLLLFIAQTLTV